MKIVYSGLEGSGKSLKLAMVAEDLVMRNCKWFEKTGISRSIYSNLKFTDVFTEWAKQRNVPIKYWKNQDDLISIESADVIIDELGNYFDSRGWENLSLDVRRWLTQADKVGVEIYGSAQDFAQVDLAFRRLVNQLYFITKVIGSARPAPTKPPVKTIWGICIMNSLDPMGYKEDKKKFASRSMIPDIFFIHEHSCRIFDTSQKIERSAPLPFKHSERFCLDCGFKKQFHL